MAGLTCFDQFALDDESIIEFLKDDQNLVIIPDDSVSQAKCFTNEYLVRILEDANSNIFLECPTRGDGERFVKIPMGYNMYIPLLQVENMLYVSTGKIFHARRTGRTIQRAASLINAFPGPGNDYVSAWHCQEGSSFVVHNLFGCSEGVDCLEIAVSERQVRHREERREVRLNLFDLLATRSTDEALALIATGQSNPGQVNAEGHTALLIACVRSLTEVALALIATGQSNPGHADGQGQTALIVACDSLLTDVALALIATGQSNPEQITTDGDTALIIACGQSLPDVALALITTGESNPGQVNRNGNTALRIIRTRNGFERVIIALEGILVQRRPMLDWFM
jgi:hypothetical protein